MYFRRSFYCEEKHTVESDLYDEWANVSLSLSPTVMPEWPCADGFLSAYISDYTGANNRDKVVIFCRF
jgi:hypothetical protein